MKQVKIISDYHESVAERETNEFLRTLQDTEHVKISIAGVGEYTTVMIVYEVQN